MLLSDLFPDNFKSGKKSFNYAQSSKYTDQRNI